MSILLADDDLQLANFLSKSLESAGYRVQAAADEASVVEAIKKQNYQLIVLDLNFGNTDGLALLQNLRAKEVQIPVMVLSARNRLADRIRSFKLGADDYITKPFSFQELLARANALLRRKADPALSILRVEDLELDPATRKVHRAGREIKLSPKEFDMLTLLLRRSGQTVSRQELLRECWGQELGSDSNLVDVYVNYVRKKIDVHPEEKLIHTARGLGYWIGRKPFDDKAAGAAQTGWPQYLAAEHYAEPEPLSATESTSESSVRSIIHSLMHDLAQPLTSLRCYLESLALDKNLSKTQSSELNSVEQQADRAIALAKSISALVRKAQAPQQSTVALHALLNDVFDELRVLLQSGLLTVERKWEPNLQVTSNPLLRQVVVLLISKLVGRNSRPLVLNIEARSTSGRCTVRFHWKPNNSSPQDVVDARTVLARDLNTLQEMLLALSGEISVASSGPEFSLVLPVESPVATGADNVIH